MEGILEEAEEGGVRKIGLDQKVHGILNLTNFILGMTQCGISIRVLVTFTKIISEIFYCDSKRK